MANFLLDENIDVRLAGLLIAQNHHVKFCQRGATDSEVFQQAKDEKLIVVTLDKDFSNRDRYDPTDECAILILRIHPPTLANLEHLMQLILQTISLTDIYGTTGVATLGGIEINRSTR